MEHRRRPERAAVLKRALGSLLSVVAVAAALAAQSPPLGSAPVPAVPLPGRAADPGKLAEARSLFAAPPTEARLGRYPLLTDVDDRALLASMADAVEHIETIYRSRYGLDLAGEAAETIVLYRSKKAYRVLQGRSERISGLESRGHAGWGLVVLYAGAADTTEVSGLTTVLRHELGHVLNRRGLGPALPPWLDEGIADDLAAHEFGPLREPRETPLETLRTVDGNRVEIRGALASLDLLAKTLAYDRAPLLATVLSFDWTSFMEEPQAQLHYAASAWLVRYLLDDPSGLADEFHAFLEDVSRGARGEAAELEAALGRSCSELESGFRAYVAWRAVGAGVGPSAGEGSASLRSSGSSSRQLDSPSA